MKRGRDASGWSNDNSRNFSDFFLLLQRALPLPTRAPLPPPSQVLKLPKYAFSTYGKATMTLIRASQCQPVQTKGTVKTPAAVAPGATAERKAGKSKGSKKAK
jgi:hypothetical protein